MLNPHFMRRAIDLAKQGEGWVSPNPLVGAVIVKNGRVIGEGFHAKRGEAHAERNALATCQVDPKGATVYVTLEPCCHHGKTPPCTEALINAGVSRVVIGSRDPNPKICGKGVLALRSHGIEVVEDFLKESCDALNPFFFHYMATKKPYVALKYAMTADGKIATYTGASKWVSGESARQHVHTLRHRYRGILVGSGTVLQDDPLLTCRMPLGRNPLRIICDRRLRLPLAGQICKTAGDVPTIVATHQPNQENAQALMDLGIQVLDIPLHKDRLSLSHLLDELGKLELDSLLVEGGGELFGSFLEEGLVNELYCYIAPKLFGGVGAKSPIGGLGVETPQEALFLSPPTPTLFPEGDLLLHYQRRNASCSPE